jgi:hypothetical protein
MAAVNRDTLSRMRRMTLAAVLSVVALGAAAPKRDPELEALADRAKALPTEFAADVLLRLAVLPRILDSDWKRELIEDAWTHTHAVVEPYKRMALSPPADTRAAALMRAFDTGLDRVSLQARAVRAMAPLSASRAREIFEWIDFDLKPSTCEDPLVPVLDDYYETLAILVRSTFGTTDEARGEALFYLQLYMWKASHPSEMASLAKTLERYKPTLEDAQYLESVLGWMFDHGDQVPREFSIMSADFVAKIGQIDEADRQIGVVGGPLLRGVRRYLVSQVSGPRCSDSQAESRAVAAFNRIADRRALSVTDLRPISTAEERPSRLLSPVKHDFLWQTGESRRLRDEGAALFGDRRGPTPEAVKRAKPWQERAELFLVDLEHWVGAREPSERDYLYEKGTLLTGLTEIMPEGPLFARAVRTSVTFLRTSAGCMPPEMWFSHVSRMLDLARSRARPLVLDALDASGDAVLTTYARLERLRTARR